MQPDLNPELISYLQGDWASADGDKTVFRIKRDSLITLRNDSIRSAKLLHYSFKGAAANYFTPDSVFAFSANKTGSGTNDFQLIGGPENTMVYILDYVSKTKMDIKERDKVIHFRKIR
jgi:hypothetical protein